ncbi:MAG: hypothetical protein M5R41_10420 [Bacteroidia bacterium]|nr:hypothetical protein [Bacteroidia bacterium]
MSLSDIKDSVGRYRASHPGAKSVCKQASPQADGTFKCVFNWLERGRETAVEHGTFPPHEKSAFYQWARYAL